MTHHFFFSAPKKESPAQITYHRNSDHEVRILEQSQSTPKTPATDNSYKCRVCSFSTNRMNVFILHNKTHTKDDLTTPAKPTPAKATPKSKAKAKAMVEIPTTTPKSTRTLEKSLREPKKAPIIDDFVNDYISGSDTETPSKKKRRGGKKTPAKAQTSVKKSQRKAKVEEKKESEETKINTEIKNELLADWSDDEFAPESALVKPEEPKAGCHQPVKKLSDKKSSELFDNLKKDNEEEVKPEVAKSPIKCRNIPKKRDFVFDEVKDEAEEVIDEKKKEKEEKKREKEEEKRKKEEEKQREIERIIKEKVEKQREKEEKRKEQEEKRKQQLEEKRKQKEEKKKQQELKKKEEEAIKQAELEREKLEQEKKKAEEEEKKKAEEKRKQEEEQKRSEEEKRKIEEKKKKKGDFDLLMEQLEETMPPVRVSRRNKNKRTSTETPTKQQKLESPTPETNKRKSSRRTAPEPPSKSDEPEIGEDEALAQEIKELLKETAVPDIVKESETDDRKLPPKERGKRIFKESKSQLEAQTKSPSKAMTESELLIAETLTQLPQTAIQFSPKKTLPSKSHTSNDNDIAESLINLSSPPKTSSVTSVPEQSPASNSSPTILNPRKRHLRALEEKSVVEEKVEPKHEHLTKRQRMIIEAQNSKAVETPPAKLETRLPKKRKSEYQSEFESVVNKKLEEEKKQASVPDKKFAKSSTTRTSRDKPDDGLFDINNMEIVFDNEPPVVASRESSKVRQAVSLSPIKITKPVASSTKTIVSSPKATISSPTKTLVHARTEPQIIKITQDNRLTRLSPIPQTVTLKNAEIRRLSFPTIATTGTKEQMLRQEVTPTHRKLTKLITEPDGTRKIIEEVQPNFSRTSPTTHPLVARASSSSPLAKSPRSMTQSPILTSTSTTRGNSSTLKPQVIVGAASNKILITSKGSLMTTTSPGEFFTEFPFMEKMQLLPASVPPFFRLLANKLKILPF